MDDYLNVLYTKALRGFQNENDILYNNFISYRRILMRILDLQQKSFPDNKFDMFISVSSINSIVKEELDKLKEINEKIVKEDKK